jgi:uncharacterized protein YjbJ (UPF0337 family)
MNTEQVKGKWKEMMGSVKKRWGKLTDDDLTQISGERERLAGILEQRYGIAKEQAEKQVAEFHKDCKC